MTPEEREAQRRSFAYGNVSMSNPAVTRELIDQVAAESAAVPEPKWSDKYLGNWTFPAKYSREEVDAMLRRGSISEERANELLRESAAVPATSQDYRFKTSEEAELLPLPLQLLRLKEINVELCSTHNTLVIENARLRAEVERLKGQRDAAEKALKDLYEWDSVENVEAAHSVLANRALAKPDKVE